MCPHPRVHTCAFPTTHRFSLETRLEVGSCFSFLLVTLALQGTIHINVVPCKTHTRNHLQVGVFHPLGFKTWRTLHGGSDCCRRPAADGTPPGPLGTALLTRTGRSLAVTLGVASGVAPGLPLQNPSENGWPALAHLSAGSFVVFSCWWKEVLISVDTGPWYFGSVLVVTEIERDPQGVTLSFMNVATDHLRNPNLSQGGKTPSCRSVSFKVLFLTLGLFTCSVCVFTYICVFYSISSGYTPSRSVSLFPFP